MMQWEKDAQEKLMRGRTSVPLTVYFASLSWTNPNKPDHKQWMLVASDSGERPDFYYTYDKDLTTIGMHIVELYRNNSMKVCVRKVQKG